MGPKRDFINWLANQRADRGDIRAQQRNRASDLRRSLENILFGGNSNGKKRIFSAFNVTAQSPNTSLVDVSAGVAFGGERLVDESIELGVIFGNDTLSEKSLNFGALGAATYTIWLRFSFDPGEAGSRVFFDPVTEDEVGQTVNTVLVHDWDVVIATASPGDEWQPLVSVAWGGATIAGGDITQLQFKFFEGDAAASYPHVWGDGGFDRNVNRQVHGISHFYDWVHAMRRQIEEIFDSALGTKWYEIPPSNLKEARDHIDEDTNPHGSVLIQGAITTDTITRPSPENRFYGVAAGAMLHSYEDSSEDGHVNCSGAVSRYLRASIHLPDGATVVAFRSYGVSYTATQVDAGGYLARLKRSNGNSDTMAGQVVTDVPVGTYLQEDLTINFATIDNELYDYFVMIDMQVAGPASGALFAAEVQATILQYDK